MKLRPKKVIDKLARAGIILVISGLVLKNEVCKGKTTTKRESFHSNSTKKKSWPQMS